MAPPSPKRTNPPPPPSSTEVAEGVDLATEILLRLPAKSLIRFQAVSPIWRSIISDPQFQTAHTLHHRNSPTMVSGLYFRTEEYRGLSLTGAGGDNPTPSLNFLSPGFKLQQHCNGLLLCRNRKRLIVCNPTTRRITQFRLPDDLKASTLRASLAFDPSKSLAFQVFVPASFGFAVFSSETSSWAQIQIAQTPYQHSMLYGPVFCGGAIFWRDRTRSRLVRLDTATHRVSQTPPLLQRWRRVHYVGECRGELVLLVSSAVGDYELVMPEIDGESRNVWVIKSYINVRPIGLLGRGGRIVVMSVASDETGEDFKVVVAFEGRVYCYSWKLGTISVIRELPDARPRNTNALSYKNVFGFAASLATV